ncbi:MAG: AMP-binding protein [Deltaproteobacteria bacterium]|nr:AMP-binding protein [Deltaproteobacteria bacterium]
MSKAHLNQVIASHLLEIKADQKPDQEIFVFERGEQPATVLTYGLLDQYANRMARLLLDHGVERGDAFVVFMRNYPEFAYALLAATTIGAIMVPVDPRSRGKRLAFLIHNSGAKAVLVSRDCLEALEEVRGELPGVKFLGLARQPGEEAAAPPDYLDLGEALAQGSGARVDQMIMDVRHPMEIIYTSGTTGDPKGVMIRNNRTGVYNILRQLVWKYKKTDVLYNGLSLTHGNAQAVTFFPALYGGSKAVFSPKFTKSRIWDICRAYGCTSFSLLGGMAAGIFNEPPKPDDAANPVKFVISAGTPVDLWEAFERRFGVQILEWYGAVEGGFAYKAPGKGPVGSFGKPIPGVMEFKVVDENDQEVGPGVSGELISRMIKGETKVDYLGLPEESSEKTRGGWLRSGDIVHQDAEGWYFFEHRKGAELRRSGDFIQPTYVETVLGGHPQVSEVTVYGIPAASGAPGESDLVAALAPFPGQALDPASVFALCREKLEANMVPSYLQLVEEIPKSISEKALDRVLRQEFAPDAANVHAASDYK